MSTPPARCDVVVVGAGLAGLAAADRMTRAGLEVVVVESDGVGGRARTDRVDGLLRTGGRDRCGAVAARAVVVATDIDSADELVGSGLERPQWKGVTTIYHAAAVAPLDQPPCCWTPTIPR